MLTWMALSSRKSLRLSGEWFPAKSGDILQHWFVSRIDADDEPLGMDIMPYKDMYAAAYTMDLRTVPIIEYSENFRYETIMELGKRAEGFYEDFEGSGMKRVRTGIIVRPMKPLRSTADGKWISIEIANKNYHSVK